MPTSDDQQQVMALLADPATYGVATVERVATHASVVFLAGERAYKLKRALRYSYLDYGSVERRGAACAQELAINRRFAPGLYLGVSPITRAADGRLAIGGAGDTVDWVVVMRRFEQSAQFDQMAGRGALTPALISALADRIARLHALAEPRPDYGGAAGIDRAITITVDNLRPESGRWFAADDVQDWTLRARAGLARVAAGLDRRRAAGKVRACHGDLHLRNICLFEGQPTPFDAIEFNPDIGSIDLLFDLAFLLMDLHGRGLDRLGNLLFNRYLDQTDESDGLAALPLLLSLRAAIRAQVTAAAGRRSADAAGATAAAAEAVRYLALARALLDPPPPPRLIAVGGLSGSGKSTLAGDLAPALGPPPGARLLRSDVLRKRAAGVAPEVRLPDAAYAPAAHAAVYAGLADEARRCLGGGVAVIADAVFSSAAEQQAIAALAAAAGVAFIGLWLVAPQEVLIERVAARRADASDATAAVVRAQVARQGGVLPGEWGPGGQRAGWQVIDAAGPAADVARSARAVLGLPADRR